jgi:hypothetical protein
MKKGVRVAAYVACAASVSWMGAARAQTATDKATAERLFAEGSAHVRSGHFEEGCPLLEKAQNLVMGIGVTMYVAACYEQRGQLLRAWEQFKTAEELAAAKGDRRRGVAHDRAERLWPRLARMKIVVAAASDSTDLVITDDGAQLPRSAWNMERPVEARVHRIGASAPNRESWLREIDVPAGTPAIAVEVPPLKPTAIPSEPSQGHPAPPPSPIAAREDVAPSPVLSAPAPRVGERERTQRIAALVVLGVGAVGMGVGIAFGFDAKSKQDASNANGHCQLNDQCDSTGLALRSNALTAAAISTGSFAAGAACLLGGVILYVTAPKHEPALSLAARVERSGGASLLFERSW